MKYKLVQLEEDRSSLTKKYKKDIKNLTEENSAIAAEFEKSKQKNEDMQRSLDKQRRLLESKESEVIARESLMSEKASMLVQLNQTEAELQEYKKKTSQDRQSLLKQIEEEKKQALSVQQKTDQLLREKQQADLKYEDQKKQLEVLQAELLLKKTASKEEKDDLAKKFS